MLAQATRYTDVRAVARGAVPRPSSRPRATSPARGGGRAHVSSPGPSTSPRQAAPAILVPRFRSSGGDSIPDWMHRELREGGRLHEYLRVERALAERRWRRVSSRFSGYKPNAKSEWKLLAAVPPRDFHRWQKTDPDFWRDDSNLRSLRRDNPDMPIFL